MPLSGTIGRQYTGSRAFEGIESFDGSLTRAYLGGRTVGGLLPGGLGLIARTVFFGRMVEGISSFVGYIFRTLYPYYPTVRKVIGILDSTGEVARSYVGARAVDGVSSLTGSLARKFTGARSFSGSLSFVGSLVWIGVALLSVLEFVFKDRPIFLFKKLPGVFRFKRRPTFDMDD